MEVKRNGNVFTVTGGGTVLIRLAVDSTGLKQHNRGEWIRHKWKVREEWKKKVEYGKRWLVEIVFSAFKRMFGEHLYSLKWKNMVQEVRIKVATYNRLVDMGAGAV